MNGVLKKEEWAAIKAAWGHCCAYCKAMAELTIEHVVPVSASGPNVAGNVVPACKHCNDRKGDAPLGVALVRLGTNPFWWKARRWFADRVVRAKVEHALS